MDIPKGAPLVYVSFSAEINTSTAEQLIATMSSLANLNVKKVYLLISTPGGEVISGLNLYNVLKGMPFELVTHNVGSINSIGNPVFQAGSKRYATENATFMFHGVGKNVSQKLEEKNLLEYLDSIQKDQRRIGSVIVENTNINEVEVLELFRGAQTKDVQFALEKGIIDEVREVKIPNGSPVIPLVFKR